MTSWFEQLSEVLSVRGEIKWLLAISVAIGLTAFIKIALNLVSDRWRHFTKNNDGVFHELIGDCFDGLRKLVIFTWMFSLLAQTLHTTESMNRILHVSVVLLTAYQFCIWGLKLLSRWREHILSKKLSSNGSSKSAIGLIYVGAQTLLICVASLLALSNIGVDVGALVAGLGVGGIAVALAAQNVLGDLLASLSIVFDKPFVIGDLIYVGNEKGTVEHIGIKTTRVRSLSGEELIFSNKDLLESRIQNFKRMSERRGVLNIGVTYSTPADKLEMIPIWIRAIVENISNLRFERCHFSNYGNSSLDFEIVFWVMDPEFQIYMDLKQALLIGIFKKFQLENIEFAYPTQTLIVEKFPQPSSAGN